MLFRILAVNLVLLTAIWSQPVLHAAETATPKEAYQMVVKASEVLENLGDEGLAAFNEMGEFAWKDSYVYVFDCSQFKMAAHPVNKLIGIDLRKVWDKHKEKSKRKPHGVELCNGSKNPNGNWVEYWWTKRGEKEPQRKLGFIIQVPGQPFQVTAAIYDDSTSVEELRRSIATWGNE